MSNEILQELKAGQERIERRLDQFEERVFGRFDALEKVLSEHVASTSDNFSDLLTAVQAIHAKDDDGSNPSPRRMASAR